ncbi:MAG: DUF1992 domain-containing protein [Desulfobacter sp.]|nr:DUF1992 domain-containing protein [Desulfobacter sp.]
MIPGFEAIVEQRIKKAEKEGAFEGLSGRGQPLEFDDINVPKDLRMAHKILKNSGFLPPEIELKKKISHTRDLLSTLCDDSEEKAALGKKLNFMLAKLDSIRSTGHTAFLARDQYQNKLAKKIS